MKRKQQGFTLMEMIGVVAVIAILASMATPMIFDAIRNARIASFVEDVTVIRTAVARYYQDTGNFPVHIPTSTSDRQHLLLRNSTTAPVGGWDGPYIEKEVDNPFQDGGYRSVQASTSPDYQFDLDGDGNMDTTNAVFIRMDNVTDLEAQRISNILDGDGDVTTGNGAWNRAGRVKRHGTTGNHSHVTLIYLSRN